MDNIIVRLVSFTFDLRLLPLYMIYMSSPNSVKKLIDKDVEIINQRTNTHNGLLYYLGHCKHFRNIFYHRCRKVSVLRHIYKPSPLIIISQKCSIGGGMYLAHPIGTIINAKSIGENFSCRNGITIGNKIDGRNDLVPTIGNNVTVGVNAVIIGNIYIGNNVVIGAGCVVTKNVPDSCIVVGNPMRIL